MQWSGSLDLDRVERALRLGAHRGVTLWGEHVLGEATKLVPIEEGTLSRSGKTDATRDGDSIVAAVSYDTPYAVRQHEEMGYRHDAGRQAKYLEAPLMGSARVGAQLVAQAIRDAL
jgi:hypothetical protein